MSHSRRRARQILVAGLTILVLTQLGLGTWVEFSPRLRDPMFGDKFIKLQRRISEKQIEQEPFKVIMLGSSRTGYGFHGQRVEAILEFALDRPVVAFNFGIPASGPVTHRVYLQRLLAKGVVPDLLLVEILPTMLANQLPTGQLPLEKHWLFADRFYREDLKLAIQYGYDPTMTRRTWWETILTPWYALRFPLLGRLTPGWLPFHQRYDWSRGTDCCGWGTPLDQNITPEKYQQGVARAHGEYAPILADLHLGGRAAAALGDLLRECHEQKIPVALVRMPEGTVFDAWYSQVVRQRIDRFIHNYAIKYDALVIDASNWVPDHEFTDGHHMLRSGAQRFSDRLGRTFVESDICDFVPLTTARHAGQDRSTP